MLLNSESCCDVLVVGSGIAGITAAMEAAEAGCSVILTSTAKIFSGSSFYPGTWGLGLIGPADYDDRQDLVDTILSVGCGMAEPSIVRHFVDGISPAIEKVRKMGVKLRRADNSTQKEFIPCFDHKHRDWNGLEFDSVREVFSCRMDELGIITRPNCEVLELVKENGRVCGAVIVESGVFRLLSCKALVLASGGYGGIFKYHLCTEDITGMGQYLAMKVGCQLVNMEFMQMMPGYISPAPRTIFNEKTFRFTNFFQKDGALLFDDVPNSRDLLELRSTHGPFTTRLSSMAVDLAIFREFLADENGVEVSYTESMQQNPPEFVKTYFDWLAKEKNLTMGDHIKIGIFAHAANGGIKIKPDASTGVSGLFACGEVTGGMHGADRIGGLSTANGLVFGGNAGRAAARACGEVDSIVLKRYQFDAKSVVEPQEILCKLRDIMFRSAMIGRTEQGLTEALVAVTDLSKNIYRLPSVYVTKQNNVKNVVSAGRLEAQIATASCILEAAILRRESRGSHYRADYPSKNTAQARRIIVKNDGVISACFEEAYL